MLDVLLRHGEIGSSIVAPIVDVLLTAFWSAKIVGTLQVICLQTRNCFFFFEAPHKVQHIIDSPGDGLIARVTHKWPAGFQEIADQVNIGAQEIIEAHLEAIKGLLRRDHAKFGQLANESNILNLGLR